MYRPLLVLATFPGIPFAKSGGALLPEAGVEGVFRAFLGVFEGGEEGGVKASSSLMMMDDVSEPASIAGRFIL